MSTVISNATNKKKIFNKKFVYLRAKLLDYIKSNRLLYLKTPLNKLLYHWSSYPSGINMLLKKTKKVTRNEFRDLLLKQFERSFIEVKRYKRVKEKSTNIKNRQLKYKENKKENSQYLQFYINKETFLILEEKRLLLHKSKQEFYSSLLENQATIK